MANVCVYYLVISIVVGSTSLSDPTYIRYECDGSESEIRDCYYNGTGACKAAATVMCSMELICNTSGCVRIK